ncbi:MAG: response regulator [Pseudomonadota bacterium]
MPRQYKILFVDDEQRVLRSLKSLFRHDYEVYVASGGYEALAFLEKQPVDIVVSDLRMPDIGGDELLSVVKDLYPQTKRILLTGYIDKGAIANTIDSGEIYRYINKPWNIADIKSTIADAAKSIQSQHQNSVESKPKVDLLQALFKDDESIEQELRRDLMKTALDSEASDFSSTSAGTQVPKTSANKRTSVLLMDPDQGARNSIRAIGRSHGFYIYGVSSHMQAVTTMDIRHDIGVAIIGMDTDPNQTLEALNLFKEHRPDLAVIVLADFMYTDVAINLMENGHVFRYLQKPVNSDEFKKAVISAIKRHQILKKVDTLNEQYTMQALDGKPSSINRLRSMFNKMA